MKALALWAAAFVVTLLLLLRYRKGAPRRLAGRYSGRFVRMVSVMLFLVGCGPTTDKNQKKIPAPRDAPEPGTGSNAEEPKLAYDIELTANIEVQAELRVDRQQHFPWTLGPSELSHWLSLHQDSGPWKGYKQATEVAAMKAGSWKPTPLQAGLAPAAFESLVVMEPEAWTSLTLAQLHAMVREMEGNGFFDPWLVGYVWRVAQAATGTGEERAKFYALLESHHRVAESFEVATAQSEVLFPRPWMSKAAPPPGVGRGKPSFADPEAFLRQAGQQYEKRGSGTWQTQALMTIVLETGSATLHRRGQALTVPKQGWSLRRLDVVTTSKASTFRLPYLGTIRVPEDSVVTSTSLHQWLGPKAQERARLLVGSAMGGDERALAKLGSLMPVLAPMVVESMATDPEAVGGPALRSLLFDAGQ